MSNEWTPPPASGAAETVPNYLVLAIISAVCCFPLGIISVVFAAQVNKKVAAGDIQGALEASKKAKMFSYIFLGLGVACWIINILLGLVFGIGVMGNLG